ncbi:hypothetical protein NEOLI_003460 [Neolecta irregularis DAH-3]|uniref:Uncharacterized protein n=1 Tax=Neolecta irregularis (strain DAH-3) TaxID=1198029 RepID=A0A1U7LL57_NEOID|nr:hypothetical protein NEOLI_003460 [Neolecta irregularis DAH-3]|eukprot:OLL23390.1 hypothetical protein NEOLI_003460 [Neolecta irregularis DAH-3]
MGHSSVLSTYNAFSSVIRKVNANQDVHNFLPPGSSKRRAAEDEHLSKSKRSRTQGPTIQEKRAPGVAASGVLPDGFFDGSDTGQPSTLDHEWAAFQADIASTQRPIETGPVALEKDDPESEARMELAQEFQLQDSFEARVSKLKQKRAHLPSQQTQQEELEITQESDQDDDNTDNDPLENWRSRDI